MEAPPARHCTNAMIARSRLIISNVIDHHLFQFSSLLQCADCISILKLYIQGTITTNMKKQLSILFAIFAFLSSALTQPKAESPETHTQKFYFPPALYKDSTAMRKNMPKLAQQLLSVYHETDKGTYYDNAFRYYMVNHDYKKAIELIDSFQSNSGRKGAGNQFKSYSVARINEKGGTTSFEEAFKKEYASIFNDLTFFQKLHAISNIDTSNIKRSIANYHQTIEKLKKTNSDSIDLKDAQSLCRSYNSYVVYTKISPLTISYTNNQEYQAKFPAIKSNPNGGTIPVQDIDELPDASMQYKLLFELTGFAMKDQADSIAKKDINGGIGEVARVLNLHAANGIPSKNIDAVIVVHAAALYAFMNNEKYRKKYDVENPNIVLIKELQDFGAKIIVCGQAMFFFGLEREDLVPGIKQALTAQTVLSSYQLKGYVYYDERLE